MSNYQIEKIKSTVNNNSRLYDLIIEAIDNVESNPRVSLKAQAEAAREIKSFTDPDKLRPHEISIIKEIEKVDTEPEESARENLGYLFTICYKFGAMAPDKKEKEQEEQEELPSQEQEYIEEVELGKVVQYENVKYTFEKNSTYKSHLKLIPIMLIGTIIIVVGIIIGSLFI